MAHKSQTLLWVLLITVTGSLILLVGSSLIGKNKVFPSTQSSLENQTIDQAIEEIRSTLSKTADPQTRKGLEEKLRILEQEKNKPPLEGWEPPPRPRGIVDYVEYGAPFRPSEVIVKNKWQDMLNEKWVDVYAGSLPDDRAQGIVIILIEPGEPEGGFIPGGWYRTPTKSGAVTIVSAIGTLLTLKAENGDQFLFDVAARKFVSP